MVSDAEAIVLPGINGETVTFFTNEKLWVIDSRSRYVALMNENGDVGFLIVGNYDDTIQMSESDHYASMVDYVLYKDYDIMLDNQGNRCYLMEMFTGFNCKS